MKWLLFAWKNVLRNRRRTLITILLTAIGTASVLIAGGFALFTYEALKMLSSRQIGHVVLAHHDYFDNDEETPLDHGLAGADELRRQLLADPQVSMVLPRLEFSGLISNGEKSAIFIGSGIEPEGEFRINGALMPMEKGRPLSTNPDPNGDPEVVLAKGLAKNLKAEVGSSLTLLSTTSGGALNAVDVQVVGIYSTGTPELDERAILTDIATAQQLLVSQKVSTLSVYLLELDGAAAFKQQLAQLYPDLALRTWDELAFFYTKVRALYNRIFGVLGIVIFAMVFFAVTNTMSMAVTERTREIGTLAALGTSPVQIVRNFVLEALVIGSLGAVLGMVMAGSVSALLHVVDVQMPPPPGRTDGYPLYIYFSTTMYALTSVVILAIAVVAAWLAARRGARKPIVEALAHV